MLDWQLDLVESQGLCRVHLCLGSGADEVVAHVEATRGAQEAVQLSWSIEPRPLGTAGALAWAVPHLDPVFVLLYGDSYTPVDLRAVTEALVPTALAGVMGVMHNCDQLVTSNVAVERGRVTRYDKSVAPGELDHVDYGVLALRRDVLAGIPAGTFADLELLLGPLAATGRLGAFPVVQRFFEIGTPHSWHECDAWFQAFGPPPVGEA